MLLIPAIDLIEGKCVRLYKGSYDQQKTYDKNPADQARIFEEEGADMIHIIDLEGAKTGNIKNLEAIKAIRAKVRVPIEVGGGIRNYKSAKQLFDIGINRIILGTAAVDNNKFIKRIINEHGSDALAISIDAKHGIVQTEGWKKSTDINAVNFAKKLSEEGIKWIIYTDISRDGTLTSPNFEETKNLVSLLPEVNIIASGGVSKLSDLEELQNIHVSGIIIGKALYEEKFTVDEARKLIS